MSKGKKSFPPKKSTKNKGNNSALVQKKFVSEQLQGPIPPPSYLSGYEQLLPGAADRILKMAEKETEHRQAMEKKALDAEIAGLKDEAQDTRP